ncbi:30S ribosomal protein S1 [Hyella patelloides LEGE 07179]|uniref:30S ribosomal protein S1 n=1 Tax=Hyella patelloides LEGE 07179 TaxID=945734 RepID=A0A563W4Z4_9CYAN|nr:S1 RNA-binding domain-containing protein [Hyella patelloides]VEP18748.1 30S ribosomal protein S1 [Hyella patelloides LEGE 07179]
MNVTLIQKSSATILIRIETDNICLEIKTSCVFDPFEELYIWLGMIRDCQLPATMAIDEEGYGVTLNARQQGDQEIDFTIEQWRYWDKKQAFVYLQKSMKAEDLIQCFYDGITDFIKERYVIPASSFVVLSNINWDSLLQKPDRVPNWKMRLAMYGGGKGQYLEAGIDTVETTLEQKELYNLRNFLYFVSTTSYDKVGILADLYKNLPVDIALGEIDSDWYKKRKQQIDAEYQVYDTRIRKKEERERLFELQKARIRTLKLGQLVDGTVVAFKPYGLFINICGIHALLHISMISQTPVENISQICQKEIFQLRGWIRAIITYLDIEKGRVGISTKELESQPGDMFKDPILVYQNAEAMAEKYRLNNNL